MSTERPTPMSDGRLAEIALLAPGGADPDFVNRAIADLIAEVRRLREAHGAANAAALGYLKMTAELRDRVAGFETASALMTEFTVHNTMRLNEFVMEHGGSCHEYIELPDGPTTADAIGTAIIKHLREVHDVKGIGHARCSSEFVLPGTSARAALHVCRGRVGHQSMHSDGVAVWGDGAALDNHPAEEIVLKLSELRTQLSIVKRQADAYHAYWHILDAALVGIADVASGKGGDPTGDIQTVLNVIPAAARVR